jgi:hypothetical protein
MNLEALLLSLHLDPALATFFGPHWESSLATLPAGGPDWLTDDAVVASRRFVGLEPRYDAPLLAAAGAVRAHAALALLAWHAARLAFEHQDYDLAQAQSWPDLSATLGEHAPLFYLLVAFQAVPHLQRAHGRRGIPLDVSRATCTHYLECTSLYSLTHAGRLGVRPAMLGWLRHHTSGELCCLGRMEYMVKPFRGRLRAFRQRESGLVVALADSGATFADSGLGPLPARPGAAADVWMALLEPAAHEVSGHPIAPDGRALRQRVTLDLRRWTPVLAPGDFILETHIPPGGGLTPTRCAESMRAALEFFPRHFPEHPFAGFACDSWVLNPELSEILTPTSNPVLWQHELYLFPVPSDGREGLQFIFGREDVDPATAPRDTSLRRALLDRLAAGKPLRAGGMFCLPTEVAEFGTQPYRRRWPAVQAALNL